MSIDGRPAPQSEDPAANSSRDTGRTEQASATPADNQDTRSPQRAEPLTREEYAEVIRGSPSGRQEQGAAAPAVTHFHAEFKGRPLDLYTDGTRWAAADTPRPEATVSGKGELPDQPAADGDSPEGSSLLDRLRREVYEESEDELDLLENDVNLVHDVFDRPPTGSYQGTSPDQPVIHGAQHAGIDAGSAATAVFTLGLVIDRAARWVVQHYENRVKGS